MSSFRSPSLWVLLISTVLLLAHSFLNKPEWGRERGRVYLEGEVISKNYNRVVLLDNRNRLWSVRFKGFPKLYPGDRLLLEGVARGARVYPESWRVERSFLQKVRLKVRNTLKRRFLEKTNSKIQKKVGSALLFGENYFSRKERRKIAHLGIYHLIVISGMHYALFLAVFAFLPVRWNLRPVAALGFFLFFTFLVLFPKAPAYRAFTSVAMFLLAYLVGRNYDPLKALFLASSIWLVFYPYWGTSLGFWLSYLASLALILYYGGKKTPEENFIRSFFGKSLGVEASVVVSAVINPLIVSFLKYTTFGVFFFGFLFTVLVQIYILFGTLNMLTYWSVPPLVFLQNMTAEGFGYLLNVLPEVLVFENLKIPPWVAVPFTLLGIGILLSPLKWKLSLLLFLLAIQTAIFLTYGR